MSPVLFKEPTSLPTSEGLVLPKRPMPNRREIFVGRGVSVYFDRHPQSTSGEQVHAQLELLLVSDHASGEVDWRRPDGSWCQRKLHGAQVCVIPRNVPHTCGWSQAAEMILLYVEPAIFPLAVHVAMTDVWVHDFAALAGQDLVVRQLAVSLQELCRQSGKPDPLIVEAMATVLAERLVEAHVSACSKAGGGRRGLSPAQLDRVLTYISRNLGEGIPIADLAKEASVSPYHFIRLFKQSTGMPPHRYILKCRLLKAKELLSTREFRVAEAAYETGFYDQSHLNRHFKKFFGFTPMAVLRRGNSQ